MKQNSKDLSCAEIIYLVNNNTNDSSFCIDVESSSELIFNFVLAGTFCIVNVTEDQLNSALNEYYSIKYKDLMVAYYSCFNETTCLVSFYNDDICGRINQQYCMVHYLHRITSYMIIPLQIISDGCSYDCNSYFSSYCSDGFCQDNVISVYNEYNMC